MTLEEFRLLALALPEAAESAHMNHPDFRVRGKIFATIAAGEARLMLTREQQAIVVAAQPAMFAPLPGGWGAKGATVVILAEVAPAPLRSALWMAWGNKAPRSLYASVEQA